MFSSHSPTSLRPYLGGHPTVSALLFCVRYFYDSGEFSDEYGLVIEKTKDGYKASWITKGKVDAIGVGMEVENGLAIGWRRVAD